jgi:kynurenine formamidase
MISDFYIVDLSIAISEEYWEPEPIEVQRVDHIAGADKLGRSISYLNQKESPLGALRQFLSGKNVITHRDFPDGQGLSQMFYRLSTHTGTHVDAPYHYGKRDRATRDPERISDLPLEQFIGPGVLIDVSEVDGPIDADCVARICDRDQLSIGPGSIVIFNTGCSYHIGKQAYFQDYRGIEPSAVTYLLDRSVRTIGTDAFSFDRPFIQMINDYKASGDKSVLWPTHVMGRDRPYIQIERLGNLGSLPGKSGFLVCCFPIKLDGADASWTRAVALCPASDSPSNPSSPSTHSDKEQRT